MTYENDVFISYRRQAKWTLWTREHFKGLLESYLQQDLGRRPKIFIDEILEDNFARNWMVELGNNLAKSRVAVMLFSRDYFDSDWCLHELDLMLDRARKSIGGKYPEGRLIIPVIGHDGELIPDPITRLTSCDVQEWRIVHICQGTPEYQKFSTRVKLLSPSVASAINIAPPFEMAWIDECVQRFEEVYDAQATGVRLPPRAFTPKPLPRLTAPPRLTL
jgi:hypothetical protein